MEEGGRVCTLWVHPDYENLHEKKVHFKLQTICLYKMLQGKAGGNGVKVVCVDPWIVLLLSIVF